MKIFNSGTLKRLEVRGDPALRREKNFRLFVSLVLLGFGAYISVLYFGYQKVPSSDFMPYIITGRQLLSFHLPASFTRPPGLGILIVCLSHFIGGSYPELTAGWLLNAVLLPFNLLLLWLVGRKIVGNSAIWIALIAILNPYLLTLSMDPIVETTFLFFILTTFYCLFQRSRWSYLFASITSLVRYEGVVLILTVFIIDLALRKTRRERALTFLYAFLSAIPLFTWLLGSLSFKRGIYYLDAFNQYNDPLLLKIEHIWKVTFSSLLSPFLSPGKTSLLLTTGKIIASVGCVFGFAYGLCRRRWRIIALLLFVIGYIFIHLFYLTQWRYWIPIFWILLFIWWYGWQNLWRLINRNKWIPEGFVITGTGVILAFSGFWLVSSLAGLPGITSISKNSVSLPYVSIGVVIILYTGRLYYYRKRYWWRYLTASVLVSSLFVSNQYALVKVIGNGEWNIEYKYLAEWYRGNADRHEKIVCTMTPLLKVFAPECKHNFVHILSIKAKNPREFIRECRRRGITYIAWDTRFCSSPKWRFYESWGLDNIQVLSLPRSTGPYKFVTRVFSQSDPDRYINIFRLMP